MPERFRVNSASLSRHSIAAAPRDGPPPSTLAAQLVENISTSAKTARSDGSHELKNLFATIQRIKDRPELLSCDADRIEHNHMLIYVYCRVALEGINLDDPFASRAHIQAEALKAINFLRFTIKETPTVLSFVDGSRALLQRGAEPLWIWLLPQVLRFLGHGLFHELEDSLEGFLQYLLLLVSRNHELWPLGRDLVSYLRSCVAGAIGQLRDPKLDPSEPHSFSLVQLPAQAALQHLLGDDWPLASSRITYSVTSSSHALRQASSLARILAYPLINHDASFSNIAPLFQATPWLLDTWLDLRVAQKRWNVTEPISLITNIEIIMDISSGLQGVNETTCAFRSKSCALLVLLCTEMISYPEELTQPDEAGRQARRAFCRALLIIASISTESYPIARLAASKLVQEISLLSSQYSSLNEGTDVWRCARLLRQIIYATPLQEFGAETNPSHFEDETIRKLVHDLHLNHHQDFPEQSVAKKRRLGTPDSDKRSAATEALCEVLNMDRTVPANVLISSEAFLEHYEKSSSDNQCLVLDLLTKMFCAADGPDDESFDRSLIVVDLTSDLQPLKTAIQTLFTKIIQRPAFTESRQPRVAAMIALRKLVGHSGDAAFLNLESSVPGQWCLQSLNSSIRELRIAAGRALGAFVRTANPRSVVKDPEESIARNRKNAIALLKSSSVQDQGKAHLVETRIMAWGQIGRWVFDDELNLVLIQLVDYLGSRNNIVSAFAFNEIVNLAEARDTNPRRLFEPFWKSLAYMATKDMIQRPQRSRAIAELLQIGVNELLLLIQTHALPWLVLDKQKDVIQRIAEARQEREVGSLLMDAPNLASTLALLLIQDTDDVEGFTKSRLDYISSHFEALSLFDLFQSEPVVIALELLKMAADADEAKKILVHRALNLVAITILNTNEEPKGKKENVVGRFLQPHVLALMARLTDVINDFDSLKIPITEQKIVIGALEEMIKACRSYARIARPQISACLLSAVCQEPLRDASISCWAAMLTYFEEEDVVALLETTFFIVGRYWDVMNSSTADTARNMLQTLLDQNGQVVEMHSRKLPSLSSCKGLEVVEKRLAALRPTMPMEEDLEVFSQRLSHDNSGVVQQALLELVPYLRNHQSALYTSAVSQRPNSGIPTVMRSLLDCACRYHGRQGDIARLCVECIGLVGCLDSNQIETLREQRSIVVLDNFEPVDELVDFSLFLLQEVLTPAFLSATDTKLQGFLSYAIQELLDKSEIRAVCASQNTRDSRSNETWRKWVAIPENVREAVRPFLTSRYRVAPMQSINVEYPIFHQGKPYNNWLRSFVLDMLEKGQSARAEILFEPLKRVIRVKDLSTAEFLLPYLVMHIFLSPRSSETDRNEIVGELLGVLRHKTAEDAPYIERGEMKRYFHAVFRCLDYAMRWIQAKRASGRLSSDGKDSITRIQAILDRVPPELISQRATECNEFARALFHLEHHAQKMEQQKRESEERNRLLEKLQDIYANIDEPDGLEGISSQLQVLDINQQILSHKKAGRWSAAQTWHELRLNENPDNTDMQVELLNCLKQAGQHEVLLKHVESMRTDSSSDFKVMPFAVEAAWMTGRWESLAKFLDRSQDTVSQDFNLSIAVAFEGLRRQGTLASFQATIQGIRDKIASGMTASATASLAAAHDLLLKCHVLTDLEAIVETKGARDRQGTLALLEGRLEILGGRYSDKQYLLGVRRAAMELCRPRFSDMDISGLWLNSARLARKTDSLHQSFHALLRATQLGDDSATIENAKLTWRDGHHRTAIQMLQGAIERNKFMTQSGPSLSTGTTKLNSHQKLLTARAQLLLAKWLDTAGQSNAVALREKYQQPPKTYSAWEKGHYYLGRHYKKILESERPLKADDQSDNYVTGEIARLVIENYLRSLNAGTKYLHQTLPRILTLWLDLGAQIDKPPDGKASLSRELHKRRVEQINLLHTFLDKYIARLPAYIFYTALPQIVARIAHPNTAVFERLNHIIAKVVEAHPRQALWSLIGIMTTKPMSDRRTRGFSVLQALRGIQKKVDGSSHDLRSMIQAGEKLAEQLLVACNNGDFHGNKTVEASLRRDLRFNHDKCTPCPLVVPVESSLTATLPAVTEHLKKHKAFSRDVVTISHFLDRVHVLSSLAKPRRLTALGSDGKSYALLIKPKDDLRTDQRLMEFNGIINRSLKRDAESSRRQLYIRTYAVVPLNEECGIIEWVPGIKTMRDILLNLYATRKIHPDYPVLKQLMEEASGSESKLRIFTDDVLGRFPAVLPLWFIQQFPNPSAWFAARLKYTRSCAVMSMVGTMLGLGDRHGENVNLEEGNGGIFHVDFNCLFDKGLTFAKPERVPFRLTHNMVAAMGIYGYEGPFRKSSELTLSILRQQEETLMTILEAFIYDPTLDLQKEKRSSSSSRRGDAAAAAAAGGGRVRLQPQSVVDSIKRKVRGLLPNESIPLSVEGQVEELIKQAVNPRNLTAMYIGWCPFL